MTTILAVIAASFAIWALISVAQSSLNTNQKVIWFAIVILLPLLGPIIYWFKFYK
ncbi:MAG: PLDc N-terminal domain-containing protein [Reichenbachiella sp.]|uniref:PLDc N-terminal domain-containing protein n=1 Tax=Reichenbachiella sp. TaxID=2184521 RepID=UPI003263B889